MRTGAAHPRPRGADQGQRGDTGDQLLRELAAAQPDNRGEVWGRVLVRGLVGRVSGRCLADVAVCVVTAVFVLVLSDWLLIGGVGIGLGVAPIFAFAEEGADDVFDALRFIVSGAFTGPVLGYRLLLAGVTVVLVFSALGSEYLVLVVASVAALGAILFVHPVRASTYEYSLARAGSPTVSHRPAGRSAWPNHPQGRSGTPFGCAVGGVLPAPRSRPARRFRGVTVPYHAVVAAARAIARPSVRSLWWRRAEGA